MVFSSVIFLFLFLPVVLALYYVSPRKLRNFILLISSLLFYTWGEEKMVAILLLTTVIDFTCGIVIDSGKRKLGLIVSVVSNLAILGFFKYLNFAFDNFNRLLDFLEINSTFAREIPHIALPIGISFYTFQSLSYTIDVYRGEVKANRNILDFITFVSFFPQLVAGPIIRYIDIEDQMRGRTETMSKFIAGIERFIIGLAKKVLIANTFATIADDIFSQNVSDLSSGFAWLGMISYAIQIYFDFSGYSDMAIGLGKMFGFDFLENFNYPYIATSIKDFWRRWHISLSTWFRDYVYIPLGGNRFSEGRTYINLFIVFFLTGLWHGASWNFIVWGLYHGLFLVIERVGFDRILSRLPKMVQHAYTLIIVIIGWVFFRIETLPDAFTVISKLFFFGSAEPSVTSYLTYYHLTPHTWIFGIAAIIFSCPVYSRLLAQRPVDSFSFLKTAVVVVLFYVSIVYLTADTYNPFIYFRF